MARRRDIEAYKRRLAKMTSTRQLEARDIGAIVTVSSYALGGPVTGRIIGFTHRQSMGLFGPTLATDVRICIACVTGPADCGPDTEVAVDHAQLESIRIGRDTDD